jgi:hypothetical protein
MDRLSFNDGHGFKIFLLTGFIAQSRIYPRYLQAGVAQQNPQTFQWHFCI